MWEDLEYLNPPNFQAFVADNWVTSLAIGTATLLLLIVLLRRITIGTTCVYRLLWLFGGICGAHLIYLDRIEHWILYVTTGGFVGLGYLLDYFLFSTYFACHLHNRLYAILTRKLAKVNEPSIIYKQLNTACASLKISSKEVTKPVWWHLHLFVQLAACVGFYLYFTSLARIVYDVYLVRVLAASLALLLPTSTGRFVSSTRMVVGLCALHEHSNFSNNSFFTYSQTFYTRLAFPLVTGTLAICSQRLRKKRAIKSRFYKLCLPTFFLLFLLCVYSYAATVLLLSSSENIIPILNKGTQFVSTAVGEGPILTYTQKAVDFVKLRAAQSEDFNLNFNIFGTLDNTDEENFDDENTFYKS